MPSPTGRPSVSAAGGLAPPPRSGAWLGASLVLLAANLRLAVASVGPVLPDIIRDEHLSAVGASVLTTLPSLCFGLFGLLSPALGRRLGVERALLLGLLVLALGTGLRGVAAAPALFGGQVLACAGIAVLNVLLPGLVKRDFPRRVALMTGLYSTALCGVAAVAAAATVPLADALGGPDAWAPALGCWALPAALAAACWAPFLPRGAGTRPAGPRARGLWRDRVAWQVTLFMGLQSALAYIVFGWLASLLRQRHLGAVEAGLMLSLSVVAQAVAALVTPALATRGRDQRGIAVVLVAMCLAGLAGCLLAPPGSIPVWAVVLGLAQGGLIALALTLIVLRAPDAAVAAQLSGMAQGVGYVLASAGPMLVGLLRSWTGGWTAVAVLCLLLGAAAALAGLGAGRARLVGGAAAG